MGKEDPEGSDFPKRFREALERWRQTLTGSDRSNPAGCLAGKIGGTKRRIENWTRGPDAPKKPDVWYAVRNVLAEARDNRPHLAALDVAFAERRGLDIGSIIPWRDLAAVGADEDAARRGSEAGEKPGGTDDGTTPCVWKAGRHLPAIRNIVEFRVRLGLNDPTSTGPCPVHAVLILGRSEREAAGRRVLIGFRALELFFETPDHEARAETILGSDGKLPPGVSRISGGWRLEPPPGEEALLMSDPTLGACLFMLDGAGPGAAATTLELVAKAGEVDIVDADNPARPINGKRRAILDAIFRGPHDPEGKGEYPVGHGEVWQENQP